MVVLRRATLELRLTPSSDRLAIGLGRPPVQLLVAVASMSSNVVGVGLPKALTPLRTSSDPAILALVKHTTPEPRPAVRQPRAKAPPHRPHNPRQAAGPMVRMMSKWGPNSNVCFRPGGKCVDEGMHEFSFRQSPRACFGMGYLVSQFQLLIATCGQS